MEFLVVICQDVKTHLVTIPDISFVGRYVMRKPESIILWTHGQKPHFSIIAMRFFSFTDAQEAHLVTWRHFYQIYGHISICYGLDSAANTRFVVKPCHQKPQPGAAQCWAAAMTHVWGLIPGAILTPGDPSTLLPRTNHHHGPTLSHVQKYRLGPGYYYPRIYHNIVWVKFRLWWLTSFETE